MPANPSIRPVIRPAAEGLKTPEALELGKSATKRLPILPPAVSESSQGTDRLVNTVVGNRYRVLGRLGSGGFSDVYTVEQLPQVGETLAVDEYAIKFVRMAPYKNDTKRQKRILHRFFVEAVAIQFTRHPGIIQYLDLGFTADGDPYIVTEKLHGQTLEEYLETVQRVGPRDALNVIREICLALHNAHALGIVHRDLKPSNIFLVGSGPLATRHIKVIDFGIAKIARGHVTVAGEVLGTPAYMSPEQARSGEITPASDFYALGLILYEMIIGEHVWPDVEEAITMLNLHINTHPPSFENPRHDIHMVHERECPGISDFFHGLVSKDPKHRPTSADEIAAACTRIGELAEPSALELRKPRGRFRAPLTSSQFVLNVLVELGGVCLPESRYGTFNVDFGKDRPPIVLPHVSNDLFLETDTIELNVIAFAEKHGIFNELAFLKAALAELNSMDL